MFVNVYASHTQTDALYRNKCKEICKGVSNHTIINQLTHTHSLSPGSNSIKMNIRLQIAVEHVVLYCRYACISPMS